MKPYAVKASEKAIQYATPAQDASFVDKINAGIRGRMFVLVTCPAAILDSIDFLCRSIITLAFANQYTGKIFDRVSSVKHTELKYETAQLGFKQAAILLVSAVALPIFGIIDPIYAKDFLAACGFTAHSLVREAYQEKAQATQRLATAQQKLQTVTGQRDTAKGEVRKLQGKLTAAQEEVIQLKEKLTQAQEEPARLQGELTTAQDKAADLQTKLDTANEKVTNLQRDLEEAKREPTRLQDELTAINEKVTTLRRELEEAQREPARLRNELTTANEKAIDLQRKSEEAQNEFTRHRGELITAKEEAANLQKELEETQKNFRESSLAHSGEITEKEHIIAKLEKKASMLEKELEGSLTKQVFGKKMEAIKATLEKMDKEIEKSNLAETETA